MAQGSVSTGDGAANPRLFGEVPIASTVGRGSSSYTYVAVQLLSVGNSTSLEGRGGLSLEAKGVGAVTSLNDYSIIVVPGLFTGFVGDTVPVGPAGFVPMEQSWSQKVYEPLGAAAYRPATLLLYKRH